MMKIVIISLAVLLLFFNEAYGEVTDNKKNSDKLRAGTMDLDTGEWITSGVSSDGSVMITFQFLIDNVKVLAFKELNKSNGYCGKNKGDVQFIHFNPNKNIHRISYLVRKLCFKTRANMDVSFVNYKNIDVSFKFVVRTQDGKCYQKTSSFKIVH